MSIYHFDFQQKIGRILNVLSVLGIWPRKDGSYIVKRLYSIYSTFIITSYNLHNSAQLVNLFFIYDDFEMFFSSALITVEDIFTNIKTIFMLRHRSNVRYLYGIVNKPSFQPKNERQLEMAHATFKMFEVMYFVFRLFPTLTVTFWAIYPILESDEHAKLPFLASYPYDHTIFPLYEITYVHQVSSLMIMAHTHVNTDCLLSTLLAIGIVQFDILSDKVKHIYENAEKKHLENNSDPECFDGEMENELLDCITHHKEVLEYFAKVNSMLNITVLGQFMLSTGTLCLTTLQVSLTKNALSTAFAALICYECSLLSQLLLYCWWGNEVMLKSQQLPLAAFESNWRKASVSYQRKLIFFIHRTQKPVIIYAVDFFRLTLDSFTGILRTSYSFYAVLRHMNNRQSNRQSI